ncbi:MAG: helix-turn-helix transcriptional regulator, partial [Candidatus Dormibacter sp.]
MSRAPSPARTALAASRDARGHDVRASGVPPPVVEWRVRPDVVERGRILRGWTRAELTEAAAIDPKTLRDLLTGRRRPTLGTVATLSRALGLPIAEVIAIVEMPSRLPADTPMPPEAAPRFEQDVLPL